MRAKDCIDKIKKEAFDELMFAMESLLKQKVPKKIVLEAIVELYINIIAYIDEHQVLQIFKSMEYAEKYLKYYCDGFRDQNGILKDKEDEEDEDDEDDGEDE